MISELVVGVRIALNVGEDLRAPELLVRSRPRAMLWAAMPETTIHEDGNLGAPEDDIRPSR